MAINKFLDIRETGKKKKGKGKKALPATPAAPPTKAAASPTVPDLLRSVTHNKAGMVLASTADVKTGQSEDLMVQMAALGPCPDLASAFSRLVDRHLLPYVPPEAKV